MTDPAIARKLIVEFLGVFALVFMGVGAIASGASDIGVALAHGLAIGLMVTATGHISGGHFNPALTIGLLIGKKIDVPGAVAYIIAQLLGGLAAALVLLAVFPSKILDEVHHGVPAVNKTLIAGSDVFSASSFNALVAEAVATFFLMLVVYGVAIDQRSNKGVFGIAIGLTISIGILAIGSISGAALNPGRWFGPAIVDGSFDDFWVWIVGPIVGAAAAALLYTRVLYPEIVEE